MGIYCEDFLNLIVGQVLRRASQEAYLDIM